MIHLNKIIFFKIAEKVFNVFELEPLGKFFCPITEEKQTPLSSSNLQILEATGMSLCKSPSQKYSPYQDLGCLWNHNACIKWDVTERSALCKTKARLKEFEELFYYTLDLSWADCFRISYVWNYLKVTFSSKFCAIVLKLASRGIFFTDIWKWK